MYYSLSYRYTLKITLFVVLVLILLFGIGIQPFGEESKTWIAGVQILDRGDKAWLFCELREYRRRPGFLREPRTIQTGRRCGLVIPINKGSCKFLNLPINSGPSLHPHDSHIFSSGHAILLARPCTDLNVTEVALYQWVESRFERIQHNADAFLSKGVRAKFKSLAKQPAKYDTLFELLKSTTTNSGWTYKSINVKIR